MSQPLKYESFISELKHFLKNPKTLPVLLVHLNALLKPSVSLKNSLSYLSQFEEDLKNHCKAEDEYARLIELNKFVFEKQKIKIKSPSSLSESSFLIDTALREKVMCMPIMAPLYCFLGHKLGLSISTLSFKNLDIVKCQTSKKNYFINLSQNGFILTDENILEIINKHTCVEIFDSFLNPISLKKCFSIYLAHIIDFYKSKNHCKNQLLLLDIALLNEPENLSFLKKRAFLKKHLQLYDEAYYDLKKYFSFIHHDKASKGILLELHNLEGLKMLAQEKTLH